MFAVIKTGGKQYRVAAEDQITVMSLPGAPGDVLAFEEVLTFSDGTAVHIGAPYVTGVTVTGEIVQQKRSPKSIAFKKRRRKNSKRKRGHRQELTIVRISEFLTGGAKPAAKASHAAPLAAVEERHDHVGIAAGAMADQALAQPEHS